MPPLPPYHEFSLITIIRRRRRHAAAKTHEIEKILDITLRYFHRHYGLSRNVNQNTGFQLLMMME